MLVILEVVAVETEVGVEAVEVLEVVETLEVFIIILSTLSILYTDDNPAFPMYRYLTKPMELESPSQSQRHNLYLFFRSGRRSGHG